MSKTISYLKEQLPVKIQLPPRANDLTGKKYGRLTCEFPCGKATDGSVLWACKCNCSIGNYILATSSNLNRGYNKSCGSPEDFLYFQKENQQEKREGIVGKDFNYLHIDSFSHKLGKKLYYNCTCLLCGNKKVIRKDAILDGHALACGCLSSKGEQEISKILTQYKINFIKEYSFKDLKDIKPLRFDFAIFNETNKLLCLIEFDGKQHFEDSGGYFQDGLQQRQHRDSLKNNYCLNNNIKLYRIKYNENLKEKMEEILNELFSK